MLNNRKDKLALIHLAKKQLGLDDEVYKDILAVGGVESAADITDEHQFNKIMDAFTNAGFSSRPGINGAKYKRTVKGNPDFITPRQEYYIRGLFDLACRSKNESSLMRLIERQAGVSDITFIPRRKASAVICCLKDICVQAGFDPDRAPYKGARRAV